MKAKPGSKRPRDEVVERPPGRAERWLFDIVNRNSSAAWERAASAAACPIYPTAFTPAWAICSSSCDCTPDTPIAPTHSFW